MTALGRWLADVLNRHIERHNVVVEPEYVTSTPDPRGHLFEVYAAAKPMLNELASLSWEPRPCWACGDPAGFHAEHLPCWKLPPFTRNTVPTMQTYGDGGLV